MRPVLPVCTTNCGWAALPAEVGSSSTPPEPWSRSTLLSAASSCGAKKVSTGNWLVPPVGVGESFSVLME